jgi:hypothetical protein
MDDKNNGVHLTMPAISFLEKLAGGILAPVKDVVVKGMEIRAKRKEQELQLEDAMHQRRIELIKQGLAADATWEIEQIRNSGGKDEWVLGVISIPLVGCFIPGLDTYMLRGFNVLGQTPDWYQWLILLIFTAIYGIRVDPKA